MDHFTLSGDEAGWLRNKTGATRLGFAVQLKFLTWRGRLPKMRLELPPDAVEHVAKQVGVGAAELGFYDFTSRAAKRHRSELRDLTGWHECTTTDQVKLASQLVDVIWHDERREEQVRAELMRQMREDLIEPPTAAQINTVIRSVLHQADERAVAEVAARLAQEEDCPRRLDALVFTDPTGINTAQGDTSAGDDDTAEDDEDDDVDSVLADIKSHPGNVSLNSLPDEISKLDQVRAVGIPEKVFAGIGVQVINAWRARASASSPSTCGASILPYGTSCSQPCCSSASEKSPTPWWTAELHRAPHQRAGGEEGDRGIRRRVHQGSRQVGAAGEDRRRLTRRPRRLGPVGGLPGGRRGEDAEGSATAASSPTTTRSSRRRR
ncbi:DUF4158 domain-containing protein [Streptomyces sp. NPDC087437]|uniref:DUF4158 domain-containing protein n=1 Tax=Streptomyces sp. NPDC087437 TaxID=3365789 RepID=UPI0038129928